MKAIVQFCAVTVFSLPMLVFSQTAKRDLNVENADNVSSGYISCAAYFTVVMQGLKRSKNNEDAAKYSQAAKDALSAGMIAGKVGRSSEMADKVSEARYSQYLDMMLTKIDHNFINISVLSQEYGEDCSLAINDPATFKHRHEKTSDERNLPRK